MLLILNWHGYSLGSPWFPGIPSDQALRGLRIDGVFCQLTNGGAWTLRGMCFPQVLDLFVSTVPAFLRSSLVPNNIGPSKQKLQAAYLHLACFVSIDQHLSTWDSPWFHMIFHDFPYDFPWFWMISRFWTIKKNLSHRALLDDPEIRMILDNANNLRSAEIPQ